MTVDSTNEEKEESEAPAVGTRRQGKPYQKASLCNLLKSENVSTTGSHLGISICPHVVALFNGYPKGNTSNS